MTELKMQIIRLELESIKLQKLLIEKFSKFTSDITWEVDQIISHEARGSIKQSQEALQYFSQK